MYRRRYCLTSDRFRPRRNRLSLQCGKQQDEAGAAFGGVVDADVAAHGPRQTPRNIKAKAAAARIAAAQPLELVKDALATVDGYPAP